MRKRLRGAPPPPTLFGKRTPEQMAAALAGLYPASPALLRRAVLDWSSITDDAVAKLMASFSEEIDLGSLPDERGVTPTEGGRRMMAVQVFEDQAFAQAPRFDAVISFLESHREDLVDKQLLTEGTAGVRLSIELADVLAKRPFDKVGHRGGVPGFEYDAVIAEIDRASRARNTAEDPIGREATSWSGAEQVYAEYRRASDFVSKKRAISFGYDAIDVSLKSEAELRLKVDEPDLDGLEEILERLSKFSQFTDPGADQSSVINVDNPAAFHLSVQGRELLSLLRHASEEHYSPPGSPSEVERDEWFACLARRMLRESWHAMKWAHYGKNIYVVDPGTIELLRDTDLPPFPLSELRLPLPAFYLRFEGSSVPYSLDETEIDGLFVASSRVAGEPGAVSWDFAAIPRRRTVANQLQFHLDAPLDMPLSTALERMAEEDKRNPCEPSPSQLAGIVLGFALYLMSEHPRIIPHPIPHQERRGRDARPGKKTRESRPTRPLGSRLGFIRVGPQRPRSSEPSRNREGARVFSNTWVRGHWRFQAHGQGRSLRKLIWIQPHIRHLGGDTEETPVRAARIQPGSRVD